MPFNKEDFVSMVVSCVGHSSRDVILWSKQKDLDVNKSPSDWRIILPMEYLESSGISRWSKHIINHMIFKVTSFTNTNDVYISVSLWDRVSHRHEFWKTIVAYEDGIWNWELGYDSDRKQALREEMSSTTKIIAEGLLEAHKQKNYQWFAQKDNHSYRNKMNELWEQINEQDTLCVIWDWVDKQSFFNL